MGLINSGLFLLLLVIVVGSKLTTSTGRRLFTAYLFFEVERTGCLSAASCLELVRNERADMKYFHSRYSRDGVGP